MTFRRMACLIAVMVAVGWVRVTQQTALRLQAYALGHQRLHLHRVDTDTRWLKAQVVGLQSPARLAQTMKDQHRAFVPQQDSASLIARSE